MTGSKKEFGRRGRPVKTHLPQGLPDAQPPKPGQKRSLALTLLGAGAVAAAAMHFLEGTPAESACVEVSKLGTTPTGDPLGPFDAKTGGGIGVEDPTCPPGTRRVTSHTSSSSSGHRSSYWAWHWSSGSSGSSSSVSSGSSPSHLLSSTGTSHSSSSSASSISHGGFGAAGGHHSSGGS